MILITFFELWRRAGGTVMQVSVINLSSLQLADQAAQGFCPDALFQPALP